jgi:hypothetical protein
MWKTFLGFFFFFFHERKTPRWKDSIFLKLNAERNLPFFSNSIEINEALEPTRYLQVPLFFFFFFLFPVERIRINLLFSF